MCHLPSLGYKLTDVEDDDSPPERSLIRRLVWDVQNFTRTTWIGSLKLADMSSRRYDVDWCICRRASHASQGPGSQDWGLAQRCVPGRYLDLLTEARSVSSGYGRPSCGSRNGEPLKGFIPWTCRWTSRDHCTTFAWHRARCYDTPT